MYIKNINTDETLIIFLILSTILISINISSLDKTILAFKEIMCQVLITKNVSQNHVLGIKLYPKWFHLEWAIREHNYVYNYMYMLARTVLPAIPSITLKILCNFYILELHCVYNVETLVWGQWALDRRDGKHFTRQRRFFSISLSCKPLSITLLEMLQNFITFYPWILNNLTCLHCKQSLDVYVWYTSSAISPFSPCGNREV